MISAHWEENEFTLTSNPKPPMIYDYGGFPDYTYHIHYDAPGDPITGGARESIARRGGIARTARRGARSLTMAPSRLSR